MKFLKGIKEMNDTSPLRISRDPLRIALGIGLCAALLVAKLYFDKRSIKSKYGVLSVTYKGKSARFKALRDSGNFLKDPLSGRSVAVIGSLGAKKLNVGRSSIDCTHLRIIPVKSIGYTGMLYGFIPDLAFLDGKKVSICVALDRKNTDFSGFDAIIPQDL